MGTENFEPYYMGRLVVVEGGNPFFFNVVLSREAVRALGIIEEVVRVFREENVSILLFKASVPPSGVEGEVRIIVSADLRDEKQAERIAQKLRRIRYVSRVEYAKPIMPGVGVDPWSHPQMLHGDRALLLSEIYMKEILAFGWGGIGPGFAGLMYRAFFEAGRKMYDELYAKLVRTREDFIKLLEARARLLGWGVLEVVELTEDKAVFRVYDNIECMSLKGIEGAENSMLRGLIAGVLSGYWKTDVYHIRPAETKCIARGDPYCQLEYRKEKYEPLV